MVATRKGIDIIPSTPPSSDNNSSIQMTANLSKGEESIIPTPGGTLKVRPFRSSSNAQLKAVLSFTPRTSALDRHNVKSAADDFRGFFTLFWIGLGLLFIRTSYQSWEENRTLLSTNFGRLITGDALVLAISDGVMVLSMFLCVPFVKGLQNRWFSYYWTGLIMQHTFQTGFLGMAVWWGYHRQWYWVQSGFLVLHALSMLMKMHSYMAHNGMLATVFFRLQVEKAQLAHYVESLPGGREAALNEAALHKKEVEDSLLTPDGALTPAMTPTISASELSTPSSGAGLTGYANTEALEKQLGYVKDSSAQSSALASAFKESTTTESSIDLRKRSASLSANKPRRKSSKQALKSLPAPEKNLPLGTSLEPSATTTPHAPRAPNPLAWSTDSQIALLATNIDAMEDELKSNGVKGLVWPQNVTYAHFADYLIIPTLVYQLEYPRTSTLRPLYVLEKIFATFGTFSLIYTITEHYIMPYTPKPGDPFFKSFVNLCLPMIINYLLIFYIIFECVCTGFAELSYFADREFYQDWWNSTTWDQFSRKWNKPVHTFLLRHVYASTMSGLQLSKASATFLTFLLSALCHELVMAVVTKKIRPYLFLMQMAQLPMIFLGRLPMVKRNKTVGNIVFWMGLMLGFPLLAICYLSY